MKEMIFSLIKKVYPDAEIVQDKEKSNKYIISNHNMYFMIRGYEEVGDYIIIKDLDGEYVFSIMINSLN